MKSRYALTLLALLPILAACSKQEAAAPIADAAPAAEAVATTEAAATTPAEANAESAAPNDNPIVAPTGPALVPGTDYVEIQGGQPFDPLDGKIEVVEVFGYVCPACNAFQSSVRAW